MVPTSSTDLLIDCLATTVMHQKKFSNKFKVFHLAVTLVNPASS